MNNNPEHAGLAILRRIAERGLSRAQLKEDSEYVDIFQHLLDEIQRVNKEFLDFLLSCQTLSQTNKSIHDIRELIKKLAQAAIDIPKLQVLFDPDVDQEDLLKWQYACIFEEILKSNFLSNIAPIAPGSSIWHTPYGNRPPC